jgi:hypothetical protein
MREEGLLSIGNEVILAHSLLIGLQGTQDFMMTYQFIFLSGFLRIIMFNLLFRNPDKRKNNYSFSWNRKQHILYLLTIKKELFSLANNIYASRRN